MLQRLNALGLNYGTDVKIKQKCLFKGPCILEVNDQCLSIRGCDACHIFLEQAHE
ncbi:FeoA domain-containing protein [Staphylococcus equorum]|uniref:FeoA family protein n=1 Tax=Staphylococcus equorum TaxID=246432 RepID=UPI003D8089C8